MRPIVVADAEPGDVFDILDDGDGRYVLVRQQQRGAGQQTRDRPSSRRSFSAAHGAVVGTAAAAADTSRIETCFPSVRLVSP